MENKEFNQMVLTRITALQDLKVRLESQVENINQCFNEGLIPKSEKDALLPGLDMAIRECNRFIVDTAVLVK